MTTSANNNGCAPLMEACTLALYQKNLFRVTGLPVDATSKEVARQAQRLQMLEEVGGNATGPRPAFPLAVPPTTDEIRDALSRMKEPEQRIVDEFFWYWPEEFGESKTDPAIQAMLAGDAERAVRLWRDREKNGSHVAQHNMAIMYHMFAVDWTNYHVSKDLDQGIDEQIKGYWRKSFERWEKIIEADELWNMLKERVRSLEDEALTTGFVRRMHKELPLALDRVNATAALKLAEQGRIGWARFHVAFMRETHKGLDEVDKTAELVLGQTRKRIEQRLLTAKSQAKKKPEQGYELASQIMAQCKPLMEIYELFHDKEAYQRYELFDNVASTVIGILIACQNITKENRSCVILLKEALHFATGTQIRERIIKNISITVNNLEITGTGACFFCDSQSGDSKKAIVLKMYKNNQTAPTGDQCSTQTVRVPRCKSCSRRHHKRWIFMWLGAAAGAIIGPLAKPWAAACSVGMAVCILGYLIMLLITSTIDRKKRFESIYDWGIIIAILAACFQVVVNEIGKNLLLNMLGGAIAGGIATFNIATKTLCKESPEVLARGYQRVISLCAEGWLLGDKPARNN